MDKETIIKELNKIGFLSDVFIDLIDRLEGSNVYKLKLKNLLKQVLKELEKISGFQYKAYATYGMLPNYSKSQDNSKDEKIDSLDVYTITSKAYQELFDLLTNKKPSDLVVLLEYLKNLSEEELKEIGVDYTPIIRTDEEKDNMLIKE